MKLRFFVPEEEITRAQSGRTVTFTCDGCPKDLKATITYVSPRAEFTPPVIYSQSARSKLVFMIEARPRRDPDAAAARRAGRPWRLSRTPSNDLAIDVHGLVKRYGTRTVVDGVSLAIEQGRICGFLGPNGSGKTTTLRMICGLLTPDGGNGTVLGYDLVKDRDAIKRLTGYMTQKFGLYEDLTIRENLEFVGRVYGLDRVKERVDQSLERLGADDAPGPAGGLAVGRLEAAPRACRLRAARAQAAAARRADRRRRSQGAPRLLGRDPRLCRRGHHRAGLARITWTRPSAVTRSPTSPTAR